MLVEVVVMMMMMMMMMLQLLVMGPPAPPRAAAVAARIAAERHEQGKPLHVGERKPARDRVRVADAAHKKFRGQTRKQSAPEGNERGALLLAPLAVLRGEPAP